MCSVCCGFSCASCSILLFIRLVGDRSFSLRYFAAFLFLTRSFLLTFVSFLFYNTLYFSASFSLLCVYFHLFVLYFSLYLPWIAFFLFFSLLHFAIVYMLLVLNDFPSHILCCWRSAISKMIAFLAYHSLCMFGSHNHVYRGCTGT